MTTRTEAPTYLRSGRWVPIAIFAIVMAIACVFLARWQLSRLDDRREANASVVANESARAVPPRELGSPGAPAPIGDVQWRSVVARGEYLPNAQLLVRKRSFDSATGYYVITALSTRGETPSEAAVLWVVRGWIPAGADARTPSSVPPAPTGEIVVEGRARVWESATDEAGLPPGQIQRIDPSALSPTITADGGADVYPFWVQAAAERPTPDPEPQRLAEPKLTEGPHLGYAIQWVFFAGGALVGGIVLVRRQREYFAEDQALAAEATASQEVEGR